MTRYFLFFIMLLISSAMYSQNLKLEEIMKGNEFIGNQPENPRWSHDGSMVIFDWNPENEPGNSTYYWKAGMNKAEKYNSTGYFPSMHELKAQKAHDTVYFIEMGAVFSYIRSAEESKKVYHTSYPVFNLTRGVNPDELFFQQSNNIWRFNIKESSLIQLTNFKKNKESEKPEEENYLTRQQSELFDFINKNTVTKEWQKNRIMPKN
jgi:hypothetical protein